MVLARRVAKLEEGLDPESAVVHWLDEAHRFPTMAAYAVWLRGQPKSEHPLQRILQQVEEATRQRLRRWYRDVPRAVRRAVFEATFRVQLVIALNVEAVDTIRVHGMRYVASYYRMRELSFRESLAETDGAEAQADLLEHDWTSWEEEARSILTTLRAARAARGRLEERYLGRHAAVFPETRELVDGIIEEAGHWLGVVGEAYGRDLAPIDDDGERAEQEADAEAGRIAQLATATTYWCLGESEAAWSFACAALG